MIRLRRPSVFAVLLTLCGVAIFIALGIWQLHRARYHEAVLAHFAGAALAPVRPFAAVEHSAPADVYPHVQVRGRYAAHRAYLLDNRMHAGQLGVDVFVPFTPDNRDRVLLVDLGFLPRQGPEEVLPELPPVPQQEIALSGLYAPPPAAGLKLGGNPLTHEKSWPKLVTWIDPKAIAADLHRHLYPRVLLLDADPASPYVRQWTPEVIAPARNRAYAFQWFTFALAAVVIFFVMHRKKSPQ
ncbi:MAG TPA: SURF1 family protein [Rhodanobacteraceae bacterium]|nr:SURF1 family protein [Rhodanobacteraceae bacterium]